MSADRSRVWLAVAICASLAAGVLATGCSTGPPAPVARAELERAETFPYFRIYWAGRYFTGRPLSGVDGQKSYNPAIGDSVYYGDCVRGKGILPSGSCRLPLQVTTVIYRLHSNANLGPQRNVLIRGVPATIYEHGRAIEIYSGRQAIDIFSDTATHALLAANELRPLNAPGSSADALPAPVFCPGLAGTITADVLDRLRALPDHVCDSQGAPAPSTA